MHTARINIFSTGECSFLMCSYATGGGGVADFFERTTKISDCSVLIETKIFFLSLEGFQYLPFYALFFYNIFNVRYCFDPSLTRTNNNFISSILNVFRYANAPLRKDFLGT